VIGRWLSLLAAQAIVRAASRGFALLLAAAVAAAAAPVSVVAAGAFAVAWLRGWPPRRLLIAAAWCAPMVVVWLADTAWVMPHRLSVLALPYHAWVSFWHLAESGAYWQAAATVAPAAIPLGLAVGALTWAYRILSLDAGAGGRSPAASVAFDQRQWRHQVRAARARITAPGSVPLVTRRDLLVAGAVIRSVGHRAGPVAAIGYQRMRSHQVVVGTTGTGKTTLLLRLWTAQARRRPKRPPALSTREADRSTRRAQAPHPGNLRPARLRSRRHRPIPARARAALLGRWGLHRIAAPRSQARQPLRRSTSARQARIRPLQTRAMKARPPWAARILCPRMRSR